MYDKKIQVLQNLKNNFRPYFRQMYPNISR